MPSTPEPSLEAPADPLPAPAASGDGAEAEPEEGSEPAAPRTGGLCPCGGLDP